MKHDFKQARWTNLHLQQVARNVWFDRKCRQTRYIPVNTRFIQSQAESSEYISTEESSEECSDSFSSSDNTSRSKNKMTESRKSRPPRTDKSNDKLTSMRLSSSLSAVVMSSSAVIVISRKQYKTVNSRALSQQMKIFQLPEKLILCWASC